MSSKSRSMVQLNLPSILRTWAELGAQLAEQRVAAPVDWASLHRIIAVARLKLAGDAERLRHVLDESRKMLHPLEEPFDVDLGLHRWLDSEREEAYSDWLEWVIFQAKNPKQVFALFHLQPPASVLECEFQIQRECCIPYGHTDHEGRLDLVIRFAGTAIIVVELKKGSADYADTGKHSGYKQWLDHQNYKYKYSLLLAASAEQETKDGFHFLSWGTVSIQMRRLAVHICKQGRISTAAMILAFVAAVEQNLLGFSPGLVREIMAGRAVMFNSEIVDHIEGFIERLET